jgi:hypothetical protein
MRAFARGRAALQEEEGGDTTPTAPKTEPAKTDKAS